MAYTHTHRTNLTREIKETEMQRQMTILLIVDDKGQKKYFALLFFLLLLFKSHDNDTLYVSYPNMSKEGKTMVDLAVSHPK